MKLGLLIDSAALAETVRTALDGVHKVQWVARDERQALRLCTDDPPELLLMQLGCEARVEFTRRLMVDSPCPILLLDMAAELKTEWVFKAMGYGALDVVQLPISDSFSSVNLALLLRKIKNITWLTTAPTSQSQRSTTSGFPRPRLIAIGASAGGPATLNVLLPRLPATLNAAVVLVQHLDDQFSAGMVEWLGRESAMPVRLAQAGELPQSGVVLLAGRNRDKAEHLVAKGGLGPQPLYPRRGIARCGKEMFDAGDARGTGFGSNHYKGLLHFAVRSSASSRTVV